MVLCVNAHRIFNKARNRPETDRVHRAPNTSRGRTMLTTAVLKRLAISLFCLAAISGPALLVV